MQKPNFTHTYVMRKYYGYSSGFTSIEILLSLGIALSISLGLLFLLSSVRNYSARLKNNDAIQNEAIELLYDIEKMMIILIEDDADSPFSDGVKNIEQMYSAYDLHIKDVSSGIHSYFMNEAFLQDETVRRLINLESDDLIVEYGWAHKNIISEKMKHHLKESFLIEDEELLFPLINDFPLANIHYLSENCLFAYLTYCSVEDAENKAAEIYKRSRKELITDIKGILKVKDDHKIFELMGYKTTFWKVTFIYQTCEVEAVFCGVPDTENPQKIASYKLVERKIRR
jgi:hypothetical protein